MGSISAIVDQLKTIRHKESNDIFYFGDIFGDDLNYEIEIILVIGLVVYNQNLFGIVARFLEIVPLTWFFCCLVYAAEAKSGQRKGSYGWYHGSDEGML